MGVAEGRICKPATAAELERVSLVARNDRLAFTIFEGRVVDLRFARVRSRNRWRLRDLTFCVKLTLEAQISLPELVPVHVWGKSWKRKNVVYQRTAKDRYARAVRSVHEWCRRNRHRPVPEQHVRISRMMQGHFAYYGITGNNRRIRWYARRVERTWRMWLSRRTRGYSMRWDRLVHILEQHPLPRARIVHRYAVASEPAT